jgi:hypothetical protein
MSTLIMTSTIVLNQTNLIGNDNNDIILINYIRIYEYLVYISTIISALFLLTTIVKANILLPLNIIWMRSGLLLGMIFGPIVLGLLFFILFTPIAFLMRLCRRDELRLKLKNNDTHWIKRSTPIKSVSFKNQF